MKTQHVDITIILDGGGGITLQVASDENRYQHYGCNADQCADDLVAIIDEGQTPWADGWDGNDLHDPETVWSEPVEDSETHVFYICALPGGGHAAGIGDLQSLLDGADSVGANGEWLREALLKKWSD